MKTKIALAALAALTLLPLSLTQTAAAYDRDDALIHDIKRDRRALAHERAERNYYAFRERLAALTGHYRRAEHFAAEKRHEQAEINAERRDLHRDIRELRRDY